MPDQPNDPPPVDPQRNEAQPVESQDRDARRRLRELQAIPDRERSDAVWDEIVALEIQLAPGNRAPSGQPDSGRRQDPGRRQGRPEQGRRREGSSEAKPAKHFFKRPKRGPGAPNKA